VGRCCRKHLPTQYTPIYVTRNWCLESDTLIPDVCIHMSAFNTHTNTHI
jgi:hypothetical protein